MDNKAIQINKDELLKVDDIIDTVEFEDCGKEEDEE